MLLLSQMQQVKGAVSAHHQAAPVSTPDAGGFLAILILAFERF